MLNVTYSWTTLLAVDYTWLWTCGLVSLGRDATYLLWCNGLIHFLAVGNDAGWGKLLEMVGLPHVFYSGDSTVTWTLSLVASSSDTSEPVYPPSTTEHMQHPRLNAAMLFCTSYDWGDISHTRSELLSLAVFLASCRLNMGHKSVE